MVLDAKELSYLIEGAKLEKKLKRQINRDVALAVQKVVQSR
jgi:hypothetical protein